MWRLQKKRRPKRIEVPQDLAAAEIPEIEIVEETPAGTAPEPEAAESAEEVDLSAEWASLLEETKEPEHAPVAASSGAPGCPAGTVYAPPPKSSSCPNLLSKSEKSEELPAEAVRAEPLVAAYEDTGHEEFHVPVEAIDPEDWTAPPARCCRLKLLAKHQRTAPVEEEIGQHVEELLPGRRADGASRFRNMPKLPRRGASQHWKSRKPHFQKYRRHNQSSNWTRNSNWCWSRRK